MGNTREELQPVIQLKQSFEYLMSPPDGGLIACKGRIKGGNIRRLVIPEDLFFPWGVEPPGTGHKDTQQKKRKWSDYEQRNDFHLLTSQFWISNLPAGVMKDSG